MIFIYHLTLTFFLYLKIRAMSLNTAGTTPAAISTTSQRLRKENPRKRPSVPPLMRGLIIYLSIVKCVLTKLCHQRFQCVDQLLLLHEQVGGRVPHNELRHLLLFLGKALKFCLATILLTSTFETNWYLYSSNKQGGKQPVLLDTSSKVKYLMESNLAWSCLSKNCFWKIVWRLMS